MSTDPVPSDLPAKMAASIRLEPCPVSSLRGPCWVWMRGRTAQGYGCVHFSRNDRGLTHRYAHTFLIGPIPPGLQVDHLCRVRACCNPLHLEVVTNHINSLRGERATKTHCKRGHELVGRNLIVKQGQYGPRRECRTCKYESQRRSIVRRQATGLPDGHRLHGTITGYQSYACRCDWCRAAGAEAWQRNPYSARGRAARLASAS